MNKRQTKKISKKELKNVWSAGEIIFDHLPKRIMSFTDGINYKKMTGTLPAVIYFYEAS
jgi:hypothetical protein